MIRRALIAMAAGLLLAVTFPPFDWPLPLALLAIAVGVWAIDVESGRQRFLIGFSFGIGFFVRLLSWLSVVGSDAWIAVGIICAFWWAVASALTRVRKPWVIATMFTAAELLRDRWPWGGFGWGQLGVLAVNAPLMQWLLPIAGQVAATWLLWFAGSALATAANLRRKLVTAILLAVAISFPLAGLSGAAGSTKVGIVQGGVDHVGLGYLGDARSVLLRHARTTEQWLAALNGTAITVWPENAVDVDPFLDVQASDTLLAVQRKLQTPLLVGAVVNRPNGQVGNSSVLVAAGAFQEVYSKQRLVPFGEFMPLRGLITKYTDRAALMPRDFQAGSQSSDVSVANSRIGLLICFEIADDNLAWDRPQPVSALVVQTNNATYDGLGESEQQLQYARLRALENRLPVFVASTNGISAVIDANGKVLQQIPQGQTGVLVGRVPSSAEFSMAARLHDAEVIGILLAAIAILTGRWSRLRKVHA